jgi:hypothetical protein
MAQQIVSRTPCLGIKATIVFEFTAVFQRPLVGEEILTLSSGWFTEQQTLVTVIQLLTKRYYDKVIKGASQRRCNLVGGRMLKFMERIKAIDRRIL